MTTAAETTVVPLEFWVWSQPDEESRSGLVHLYFRNAPTGRLREKLLEDLESLGGVMHVDQFPDYFTLYWAHDSQAAQMVSGTGELIEVVTRALNVPWPCSYGVIGSEEERDAMARNVGNVNWAFQYRPRQRRRHN